MFYAWSNYLSYACEIITCICLLYFHFRSVTSKNKAILKLIHGSLVKKEGFSMNLYVSVSLCVGIWVCVLDIHKCCISSAGSEAIHKKVVSGKQENGDNGHLQICRLNSYFL